MPIYVAEDSADTWTHPEIFQLDKNLIPKKVAGVPPDYFSADGQLWGNPLYRWHRLRRRGYDWWVDRMKGMSSLFDIIRIDHFIGFANYYSVKHGSPNARNGKWIVGPGKKLFQTLNRELPGIRIVAEDLGCVNARVQKLLDWCGYPGMKVLTFGFDSDESNPHYIDHYTANTVAYTGTHDNDTVRGWAEKASPEALAFAGKKLGFSTPEEAPEAFIRALFESPCDTVIVPMQDVLGLDGSTRMNFPGITGGNWQWRMKPDALTADLSLRFYTLNRQTNRR
jgi:4-alpha-glucanotransferase